MLSLESYHPSSPNIRCLVF